MLAGRRLAWGRLRIVACVTARTSQQIPVPLAQQRHGLATSSLPMTPASDRTDKQHIDFVSKLQEAVSLLGHSSSTDQWAVAGETFINLFGAANDNEKTAILTHLANEFGVDRTFLDNAIAIYQRNGSTTQEVRRAATPLYQFLFQAVGNRFGGVKCVCDVRAHVMEVLNGNSDAVLKRIEETTKELLTMWFCLSNLTLERLTWQSPADILHKVAKYEAVHPVAGITDLQRRVGASRRCFLFTHEAMPREPLVVVHVALTNSIADNLQTILKSYEETESNEDERRKTSAIYYSISSTQKGLAGIDLGNLLIKGVVEELERDLPRVKTHATLSPIPGFRAWVLRSLKGNSEYGDIVSDAVIAAMKKLTGCDVDKDETTRLLLYSLSTHGADVDKLSRVKNILMHLAAVYLLRAKRNGFALNPVANFHIRNGAEMHRLNWAADTSARGMERSFGIMVNYKYNLDAVHENSDAYTSRKHITAHEQLLANLDFNSPDTTP